MQFERDGFIGIFENAIEKDYCDSLIEYFNLKGNRFINPTQGLKHDNDMTEMFLDDPRTLYDIHPSYVDHFFEVLWKKIFPVAVPVPILPLIGSNPWQQCLPRVAGNLLHRTSQLHFSDAVSYTHLTLPTNREV